MELKEVDTVIEEFSGLSRKVLDYSMIMKRMVDDAKQPGFSLNNWQPLDDLAALVDIHRFERVGNFKEVMNWQEYINFLINWAPTADWECSFKRITEQGNVVLLELEERTTARSYSSVVNSLSVYEFNNAGKIEHLDIYLQMELPPAEMLQSYEGVV